MNITKLTRAVFNDLMFGCIRHNYWPYFQVVYGKMVDIVADITEQPPQPKEVGKACFDLKLADAYQKLVREYKEKD